MYRRLCCCPGNRGGYKQVGIIPSSKQFVFYDKRDSLTIKIDYETSKTEDSASTSIEEEYEYLGFPSGLDIRITNACILGNQIALDCSLTASGGVPATIKRTPVTTTITYGFVAPDPKTIVPDAYNTMNMKKVEKGENVQYGSTSRIDSILDPSECDFSCTYFFSYNNINRRASFSAKYTNSISYRRYYASPSNDSSNLYGMVEVRVKKGYYTSNVASMPVNQAFVIQCS